MDGEDVGVSDGESGGICRVIVVVARDHFLSRVRKYNLANTA